jgi:hypothetical protein
LPQRCSPSLFSQQTIKPNRTPVINTAGAYIVRNLVTELEQLDNISNQWNGEPKEDQSEDKDSNNGTREIPDPNGISRILQGEPSAVNDNVPFNMDEEMLDKSFSGLGEEDTNLSAHKSGDQLEGPLWKIPKNRQTVLKTSATIVVNVRRIQEESYRYNNKHTYESA